MACDLIPSWPAAAASAATAAAVTGWAALAAAVPASIAASAAIATTIVLVAFMTAAGWRPDGLGIALAFFLHRGFAAQFDPALIVDQDDFHANFVADVDE